MLEQINDFKIEIVNTPKTKNICKGRDLFNECYPNIYICAKKKSGKTMTIYNIIKNSIDENTKVYFFVGTIERDPTYKEILKYLDKNNIKYEKHTSIYDGKIDFIKNILDESTGGKKVTKKKGKENKDEYDPSKYQKYIVNMGSLMFSGRYEPLNTINNEIKEKKNKEQKLITPKILLVFDDISNELQAPSITAFLKRNRHYKAMTILSSQYLNDLAPQTRRQLDYWLLFKGFDDDKLEQIYRDADISVEFDEFKEMYKIATNEQYNFFYIDTVNNEFRKNFSEKFI